MFFLSLNFLIASSEDPWKKLKGVWEQIPIRSSLDPSTDFVPINIDDIPNEADSTIDMFIFQDSKNVEWVSDIRGLSPSTKPNIIPNSVNYISKAAYLNDDNYPDLLICSQDQRTLKVLRNKVRENLEILKKEQLNPDYLENSVKLDDWPKQDLITVEKGSIIIDFLVADLNRDGVPDIILAVKHKDGTCSIIELIFDINISMKYTSQDIRFENTGIMQLLGVYDLEPSKYSIIYLSTSGGLEYMVNKDPLYSAFSMVDFNITTKLTYFFRAEFGKDNKLSFFIGVQGLMLWVYSVNNEWNYKQVFSDGILQAIPTNLGYKNSVNLVLLYKDKVIWATEAAMKNKNEEFAFDGNGEIITYHLMEILFEQSMEFDRVKVVDLEKKGMVDLLVFNAEEGMIYWGRKKPADLKGIGWGPDFWIYIMIYVMLMSMGAGLFHSHYSEKIEEKSTLKYDNGQKEFMPNPIAGNKNKLRKTTV